MLDLPWITALPDSVTIVLFKQPRFFFIKNADFYAPSIAIFLINRIHLKHDRTIFSVSSHFRLYKKRPQKCAKDLTCRNTLCIIHRFTASPLHRFTASPLHSFTASQLHSFTASQLFFTHFHYHFFSSAYACIKNKTGSL